MAWAFGPREYNTECASLAFVAVHLDPSCIGLDGPPSDGQSETDPASLARTAFVNPVEPLEDLGAVWLSDSGAFISDFDDAFATYAASDRDRNIAIARSVIDGIVQ